eukprot:8369350-Prorocentrum_lima.AAC.1
MGSISCAFCVSSNLYRRMFSVVVIVLLSHAHAVGSFSSRERAWNMGIKWLCACNNVSSGMVGSRGVPVCASAPNVPLSSACTMASCVVPRMLNCG